MGRTTVMNNAFSSLILLDRINRRVYYY